MSDWVSFEAEITPLEWGRAVYTILRLPPEVAAALAGARRVEGELADHPVNLAVTRAPVVDGAFLWAGKTLLDRAGLEPGQRFDARLRPAPDDRVDTPQDLEAALQANGALDLWHALSPGRRRGHLYQIEAARRPETRAKRVAALIAVMRA